MNTSDSIPFPSENQVEDLRHVVNGGSLARLLGLDGRPLAKGKVQKIGSTGGAFWPSPQRSLDNMSGESYQIESDGTRERVDHFKLCEAANPWGSIHYEFLWTSNK
jgi:hypothetical protein